MTNAPETREKQADEREVAWVTAAPELVVAVRTAKQFLRYVSAGPFQYAIAEALALPDSYYSGYRQDLQAKRDMSARCPCEP